MRRRPWRLHTDHVRPRSQPLAAHRRGPPRLRAGRARRRRRDLVRSRGRAPGATDVPSGLLERGLLLKLRFAFDHYVNLRPSRLYPGVPTPLSEQVIAGKHVDFVVVREGTEGLYCGNGGLVRTGTPHEIATEVSVNTAYGVERVIRDAFERATTRRNKITLVHKHNVLVNAGGLWNRLFNAVAAEYPSVTTDYLHVDAATIFLVTDPARFDVIVTDNLFGDILTDLAAAVTGGIGLAASGNINPDRRFPSMFEPVHGSAPDIAGQGIADPTATILSVALLLNHCGLPEEAARIERAVTADIEARTAGQSERRARSVTPSLRLSRSCAKSDLTVDRTGQMGEATSGGGSCLVGPYLKNHGYDRVLLAGPATRLVGGHLMLTIGCDRPCVRIHVVHELFP